MEQRYRKAANWELLSQVAQRASIPVTGNGDVLTAYEARRCVSLSRLCQCAALQEAQR